MNITWDSADQHQWNTWHTRTGGAIQQSWAYGEAIATLQASDTRCTRAVVAIDGQVVAIAQLMLKKIAGVFSIVLCSRGPLWLEALTAEQQNTVLVQLKRSVMVRRPRIAFFSPDNPADQMHNTKYLRRVMTGYSTVRLDLSQSTQSIRNHMHPKWRNRLVSAEASDLTVHRGGVKPAQYAWLLEREGLQRQQRGYFALPADFVGQYQRASGAPASALLVMRADYGREPAAAMMFLIHGSTATYHIGWAGEPGRKYNAHNLLLWRAIAELKKMNVQALDMGGVNTQRGAGIARFKIGTGGQVQTFSGTYC